MVLFYYLGYFLCSQLNDELTIKWFQLEVNGSLLWKCLRTGLGIMQF